MSLAEVRLLITATRYCQPHVAFALNPRSKAGKDGTMEHPCAPGFVPQLYYTRSSIKPPSPRDFFPYLGVERFQVPSEMSRIVEEGDDFDSNI